MADRLARAEARRFSEARAAHYVRSMLSSVAACHRRDVCHRDIKLANFVVAAPADDAEGEGRTKLIDFGFSRIYRGAGSEVNAAMRGACGTPDCMPPEMLIGEYYGPEVGRYCGVPASFRRLSFWRAQGANAARVPADNTRRVLRWRSRVGFHIEQCEGSRRATARFRAHDADLRGSGAAAPVA